MSLPNRFSDQAGPVVALGALSGAVAGALVFLGLSWQTGWRPTFEPQSVSRPVAGESAPQDASPEPVVGVVERVMPAVASVTVRKEAAQVRGDANLPFFLFNGQPIGGSSVPNSTREDGLIDIGGGTAFFVTSDGLLLTNRHVVEDTGARYFVTTQAGDEYEVDVVDRDSLYDVAVLRIKGDLPDAGFPVVDLAEEGALKIGETVIAVGNALGEFQNTVTKGIVSGVHRDLVAGGSGGRERIQEAIQTDAAINPGNSGGPLVNLEGQVVGINTAVSERGNGLGFAIPIAVGKKAIDDIVAYGHIVRPWLGIRYVMLDEAVAVEHGFPKAQRGAYIPTKEESGNTGVVKGSPAEKAGLQEGDIIIRVNDQLLGEDDNLATILNGFKPGSQIRLEVLRDGVPLPGYTVTLGEFSASVLE